MPLHRHRRRATVFLLELVDDKARLDRAIRDSDNLVHLDIVDLGVRAEGLNGVLEGADDDAVEDAGAVPAEDLFDVADGGDLGDVGVDVGVLWARSERVDEHEGSRGREELGWAGWAGDAPS